MAGQVATLASFDALMKDQPGASDSRRRRRKRKKRMPKAVTTKPSRISQAMRGPR